MKNRGITLGITLALLAPMVATLLVDSPVSAQTFFTPAADNPPAKPAASASASASTAKLAPAASASAKPAPSAAPATSPAKPAASAPASPAKPAPQPSLAAVAKPSPTTPPTAPTAAPPPTLSLSSLVAAEPTCDRASAADLVAKLTAWTSRFQEVQKAAFAEHGCDAADVFCLDRFGDASADTLPDRVVAGSTFTVEIIAPALDSGRLAISASVSAKTAIASGPFETDKAPALPSLPPVSAACALTRVQTEALHQAATPIALLASHPGLEAMQIPAGSWNDTYWTSDGAKIFSDWSAWAEVVGLRVPRFGAIESKVEVPSSELSLNVDFARTERGTQSPSVEHHYEVPIDNGQYRLELSVLVPFVFRGSRTITLTSTPSGTQELVGLDQDWHVTGAVMIDYFPFGRQRGQTSSFDACRSRSCFENWLGIQFGPGLDHLFQEWYLGAMFEPVSGFAVGVGASLLKGQFFGPGESQGMLLPSSAALTTQSDFMVRPYFGIAITTDIFQTLDRSAVLARLR